ncbi:MAG: hypothetical protein KA764_01560 [Anaerolineales bacterium]|nr:hypothetical protein [Anaerolineales bacterium]
MSTRIAPTPNLLTPARRLSVLIVLLAAGQALGGLLIPGLYRDNALITAAWIGNDLVTLAVAVPLLVAALVLARRGSARAQLVWLGLLDYMLYNYAFYLFGAAFNAFFLVYTALFALSLYALICAVPALELPALGRRFSARTPARLVAGYMLLVALALTVLWGAMSLGFVFSGAIPPPVVSSGHVTGVVFALDLSLVVPLMALAGVWLWQRRPWGYALAAVVNVKGAVYMLALSGATLSAMWAGIPGAGAELPIWVSLGLGSLMAAGLLLANLRPIPEMAGAPSAQHGRDAGTDQPR